jgi:hypothetical protein
MVSLVIAYALNIIDYAITAYWVNLYGYEIEANPLMRWYFENNIAWSIKIFGVGALMAVVGICIYKKPRTAWAAWVLLVTYTAVTVYHIVLAAISFL